MKVQQFIKKLNNTELGRTGIHENYVLVPQSVDLSTFFDATHLNPIFYDRRSGTVVDYIRYTSDRENRIVGLGQYYRINKADAGDKILFERSDSHNDTKFYIDLIKYENLILFQKMSKGFEVLNPDRLQPKLVHGYFALTSKLNGDPCELEIRFKGSFKKREDSPIYTDFYDLTANGINIMNNYSHNELIELSISQSTSCLNQVLIWQKYYFKWED